MAKNLKFTIKNSQIAAAVNLSGLTESLQKKNEETSTDAPNSQTTAHASPSAAHATPRSGGKAKQEPAEAKEDKPRVRARAKSAFVEGGSADAESAVHSQEEVHESALAESHSKKRLEETTNETPEEAPPQAQEIAEETLSKEKTARRKTVSSMTEPEEKQEQETQEKQPQQKIVSDVATSGLETADEPASITSSIPPPENKTHESAQETTHTALQQEAPKAPSASNHAPSRVQNTHQANQQGARSFSSTQRPRTDQPQSRTPAGPYRARTPYSDTRSDNRSDTRSDTRQNAQRPVQAHTERHAPRPAAEESYASRPLIRNPSLFSAGKTPPPSIALTPAREKLGPTGKHVRDLLPPPKPPRSSAPPARLNAPPPRQKEESATAKPAARTTPATTARVGEEDAKKGGAKTGRLKEFQDVKPVRKGLSRGFDARDRQGLRSSEEDSVWRKRKNKLGKLVEAPVTVRPTSLHVRLPISVKDLAAEMKIKASQVIEKIFLHGLARTINDFLDDPTLVELIGHELGCELVIDTKEEDRIRITGQTVREEVAATDASKLIVRPPIVAFMGHVDHGKTSLIDAIRKSNRVAGEAGAITQHIGAFQCVTPVGKITVLDTPGHEAFSAMRARGADVTDIVVLVVAGDEGIRQQTIEAIEHAKAANVTIVVAINKCDKPNFNAETVYRQLSEHELLPEAWGGSILTINCSAVSGAGIPELLEMLALQSEVLELRADPTGRARGRVIESEMHKGMGPTATILVQNGTLRKGDSLVFDQHWGRVKTMRNDVGGAQLEASPSTPVEITGLSGLPEAGQEFIVVSSEREAREISEKRMLGFQQNRLQQAKKVSLESLAQQASDTERKILYMVLRADMQGSLEALQTSLKKIHSKKVAIHVMAAGVGEISESDVQLAAMSKGVILGFHSSIESHAESIIRQTGVQVYLHDIIYHAVDEVKLLMAGLLDRIAVETEKGKAEVLEIFHSSQMGLIAGCRIIEGSVMRNYPLRLRRDKDIVWQGSLSSLKRGKEDAREVQKGIECGMVLQGCKDVQKGDIIEAYEITYITQEL